MKTPHWIVSFSAIAGLGVAIVQFTHPRLEASPATAFTHPDLLLNRPAPAPGMLPKLERSLFAMHTVAPNEDLWAICKKYGADAFSIRSSNGLDLEGITAGMVLRIPNRRGTWYEV